MQRQGACRHRRDLERVQRVAVADIMAKFLGQVAQISLIDGTCKLHVFEDVLTLQRPPDPLLVLSGIQHDDVVMKVRIAGP